MKKKILIYGAGKTGSLIAYELAKEKHKIIIWDIAYNVNLAIDLKTINRDVDFIDKGEIKENSYDLVIISTEPITMTDIYDGLSYLKEKRYLYIFSNLDDELYKKVKKLQNEDKRIVLCGSSVNNARYKLFFGKNNVLKGDHWREQPEHVRKTVKNIYYKYIYPYHYGAVYYALKEIKKLLEG